MFGYIRPFVPELKVRDLETYRAFYCGLCAALGKRYSFFMRMILSYDATFLALLQQSFSESCPHFEKKRCPVKLFAKKNCCRMTSELEFSADTAVILFHYKLEDNRRDGVFRGRLAAGALLLLTRRLHRLAAGRRPQVETIVSNYLEAQRRAEQAGAGVDSAAHPTGEMMAALLTLTAQGQANERALGRMGYFLGRWVYFADAADDLDEDLKAGGFNPFARNARESGSPEPSDTASESLSPAREEIRLAMNASHYEICAAFELLKIEKFRPILENIVYLGLPAVEASVVKGEKLRPV